MLCEGCGKTFEQKEPINKLCSKCVYGEKLLIDAIAKLKEKDFRYTVEANSILWDVYYISDLAKKPALIAFRVIKKDGEDYSIIGAIGDGNWTKEKMIKSLINDNN